MKRRFGHAIFLVIGLLFVTLSFGTAFGKEPIKLGIILDLTGFFAETGRSCQDALTWVLDETNEKGGILGHKIEYKIVDDSSQPDRAAAATRRYIDVDNVHAIVGPTTSGSGLAALKIAGEEKVPVFGIASSDKLTQGEYGEWWFAFRDDTMVDVGARLLYAKKQGYDNIGIVWVNYEWGRTGKGKLYSYAKELGLSVVGDVPVERGTTECTAEIAKMKAMNPDIVILYILTKELAATARAYAALDWHPVSFATGPPIRPAMKLVDPKLMDGWLIAPLANENAPEVQAVLKEWKAKTGRTTASPDFFAGMYDATNVFLHSLKTMIGKGEPITRLNIRKAMEEYSAGVPMISPVPRKSRGWGKKPPHRLMNMEDTLIAKVENGKLVFLVK